MRNAQGQLLTLADCTCCGQLGRRTKQSAQKTAARGHQYRCGECKNRRHGQSAHRTVDRARVYSTWASMKTRCNNPNHVSFKDYGGRGISVCAQWDDFRNFYADMGDRPEGMSIDRIDVDGNYEPGNCRWATDKEQRYNQRRCA